MCNKQIPLTTIIAAVLWLAGAALIAIQCLTPHGWGQAGLFLALGAATLSVRDMIHGMEQRERNAFTLGQESAVRSIDRFPVPR